MQNGDKARIWSSEEVIINTMGLSQYCSFGDELTGRCTKDSFDPDHKEVGQEKNLNMFGHKGKSG